MDALFARFDAALKAAGDLAMGGQIVDATIVAAPKQRNTETERAAIKAGEIPQGWAGQPAKLRLKDGDARWTVKFSKAKPPRTVRRRSTWQCRRSAPRTTSLSTASTA